MCYDEIVQHMGEFGPYQRRIFLILTLPAISWAFLKMGGVFTEAKPDFRCLLPDESPENATYNLPLTIKNVNYSRDDKSKNWPQCEIHDSRFADSRNTSIENLSSTTSTVKCNSFVYDITQYTLTATTEWDLVCDRTWLRSIGDSIFMLGDVPGVVIFGGLSDRYGRKPALLLGLTIQFVFGTLVAVSPEFITFTIFRLFVGTTISGVYLIAYIIAIEMVGQKHRMAAGTSMSLFSVTGFLLVAGLSYFIRSWRILQIVFTIPSIACLISSRHIPESARWLMAKGRRQEAKDILCKASLENGVELSRDTLNGLLVENIDNRLTPEKTSMLDILRSPHLRKATLILVVVWFSGSLVFYGLSWNTSNLVGNDYMNFVIAAIVEIPAHLFVYFTINQWGGKINLCGSMFLSGLSLLLISLVPTDMPWLVVLLVMIGKLTSTVSYATMIIFSAEQYPTAIRSVGVGACSAVGRLGAAIAPYINHLFDISAYLPFALLGLSCIIAGLLSLLLTETLNKKLPESIQEEVQVKLNETSNS